MSDFDEIIELIKSEDYDTAEELLNKILKKNRTHGYANYLLGMIYNEFDNPNRSREKAQKYFEQSVSSDEPVLYAFTQLARLSNNRKHSIRILKKGLQYFPDSVELFEKLLRYLDDQGRLEYLSQAREKDIYTQNMSIIEFNTYMELDDYEAALNIIEKIQIDDFSKKIIPKFNEGSCLFELEMYDKSLEIFNYIIDEDISHEFNYAQYFCKILCLIKLSKIDEAIEVLDEIPRQIDVYGFSSLYTHDSPLYFDAEQYFLKALNQLEKHTDNKNNLAKIRGLRGTYKIEHEKFETTPAVVEDLIHANSIFSFNTEFCQKLKWYYEEIGEGFKAFKYAIQYLENSTEDDFYWYAESGEFISRSPQEEINKMINYLRDRISKRSYIYKSKLASTILNQLIEILFDRDMYREIIDLAKLFSENDLKKSNILFEVAYSYNETGNKKSAEKFYYMYVDEHGMSSAVANNLGLIKEDREEYEEAIELFQKSLELDPENEKASRNINRVMEKKEELEAQEIENRTAYKKFKKENPWIQNKIISFAEHENEEGLIVCPYRQLPQFLSVYSQKANSLLKQFLDKNYIQKIRDHNLNTSSSVYKINPLLKSELKNIKSELKKEEGLISIAEKFNTQTMQSIGYSDKLISSLQSVSSIELQKMLQRDLRENAYAMLSGSYKSVLILSGSIIESLLLDKMNSLGIKSYPMKNGKKHKINKMSLSKLLYVAKSEDLIDDNTYHLSHAVRGFRNLIHPGVEQRKQALNVTKDNASIAWEITKKIISDL